jgi:hypothetical protein
MSSDTKRARNLFIGGIDWAARDAESKALANQLVEYHRPCLECGLPVQDDKNQRCNLCKKARKEDPYE